MDRELRKTPSEMAAEKFASHKEDSRPVSVGGVAIRSLERRMTDKGAEVLEIHVRDPEGGDPHFRIINLPEPKDGDHLKAVVDVIARHGGKRAASGRSSVQPRGGGRTRG